MRNDRIRNIITLQTQIDALNEQLSAAKEKLLLDMQEGKNPRSFILDNNQFTLVEPVIKTTINSKKLKEELPDVFKRYSKETETKASLRITKK